MNIKENSQDDLNKKKKISFIDIIFYIVFIILIIFLLIKKVPNYLKEKNFINQQINLELIDTNNIKYNLSELKGKSILLVFWASWCSPCRLEIPVLNDLYKTIDRDKLYIFGINSSENINIIQKSINEFNILYPVVIDSNNIISNKFKINVLPTIIFIDKNGIIKKIKSGYSPFLKNEVINFIN